MSLIDFNAMLMVSCMVFFLGYLTIISSRPDVTIAVQSGKYIPEVVITNNDTQGGVLQRSVEALEQGSREPLVTLHQQQTAPELQSSNQTKVSERASSSKKQQMVALRLRHAVRKVQRCPNAAALDVLPTATPSDVQTAAEKNEDVLDTKSQTLDTPIDDQKSVEAKNDEAVQIEPETIETPADVQTSVEANDEGTRTTPKTITNRKAFRIAKNKKAPRIKPRTFKALTKGHVHHDPEGQAKPRTEPTQVEIAKALFCFRPSDEQKNSKAFSLESRIVELPVGRKLTPEEEEDKEEEEEALQVVGRQLNKFLNRFSTVDDNSCTVSKEDIGNACDVKVRRLMRLNLDRFRSQISRRSHASKVGTLRRKLFKGRAKGNRGWTHQDVGADSCVEADGSMVGLEVEVEEQVTEGIGAGESMEVDKVDEDMIHSEDEYVEVDEVMIGSDVEAEMEVCGDEVPNSDGDSGTVVGEPMELGEDNPQVQANTTSNQSQHGTVNTQNLQDRIQRETAETALRQASTQQVISGEMASDSMNALAQSSQQHAAPVSTSQTTGPGISVPQGGAQNITSAYTSVYTSAYSEADLREARRGKKREPRTVPEGGNTSESDQSITTPASTTPPSTASSMPPTTPPSGNMVSTSGSSTPASAKGVIDAPKKQDHKRSSDSSGRSRDDEESGGASKEKVNQSNQRMPDSGSSNVSATRRVLLSKPAKRVRKVQTGNTRENEPAAGPSSSPQSDPAESSKKARSRPKDAAGSKDDEKLVPLNEMPDKALTGKCTS